MTASARTTAMLTGAALATGLAGSAIGAIAAVAHPTTVSSARSMSGASVVEWNRQLVSILGDPKAQPPTVHPTRSFAMLAAAQYDAVMSITHAGPLYRVTVPARPCARADAAADQAAHDVLVALYPTRRSTLDQRITAQLAAIPESRCKKAGRRVGAAVARRLVALRAADGSSAVAPRFVAERKAGAYRPTSPSFQPPVFTGWGSVRPFVLHSGQQFRPAPYPALNSAAYATALNEVKSLGGAVSTRRSPDQTAAGKFWSATPLWILWNQVAQHLATSQHSSLDKAVKVFAHLDLAQADATIALYDAKYHYRVWRPVTAIRLAPRHDTPGVIRDSSWTPLLPTAPDPSYPSGHSTLSEAAATVLAADYGLRHITVTSKNETRRFASVRGAADEAGLSRIWAGQHTRIDHMAGRRLGRSVAEFVLGRLR